MIEETILDSIKFPQHWKPIRFREVFNYREKLTKQEMPILGTNVNLGVTERFEGDGRPAASEDLTKYKLVEPGDIVMNPLGKPHGSIGISDKSGITSPAYWVLRCNEGFYGKYLHYLLRTELILNEFRRRSKNLPPNQFDLPWEEFRKIQLPFPSYSDQKEIANYLDDIFKDINILRSEIEQFQGLLSEEFSIYLTELFNQTKDTIPIKYLYKINNGNSVSADFIEEHNLLGVDGTDFVATKDVDTYFGINDNPEIRIPENLKSQFRLAKAKSILICSEGGSAGKKFAITEKDIHYGNKLFALYPEKGISTKYLYYYFQTVSFQSNFRMRMNGMIGGISKEEMGNIPIPYASISEAEIIADNAEIKFNQFLKSKLTLEKLLSLLDEYKKVVSIEAITGLDVKFDDE